MRKLHTEHTAPWASKSMSNRRAKAQEKATDAQWEWINIAVNAFITKYPYEWMLFQRDLEMNKTTYNEANEQGLKQAQWRNTAAFPVIYRKDPETGELREHDAMLPVLNKIIPGLTHKYSKNYTEFLRRYPMFSPSEKSNSTTF